MPPGLASGALCCGPSLFVSAALLLSIYANSRCKFVYLNEGNSYRDGRFGLGGVNAVGLWCFQASNGLYYDSRDFNVDNKYDQARAFGTTTMAFGLTIWLFYLFAGCFPCGQKMFMFVGLLCILNCIFQSLVFLINQSVICEGGCTLDIHGKCAISAAVLWFVAGLLSCPAGNKGGDEPRGGDEDKVPDETEGEP